ncbi:MAG: hypothetical protein IKK59_05560 [Lachnospiraceae bacterium]|nr:hypothetical protein [Lachnospiraceae bacterium]
MVEKIRLALRISTDALNTEIEDTIDACYKDMQRVGINIYDDDGKPKQDAISQPLIISCVKLYARWQFNFENAAERYEKAYNSCRDGISLCGDYHV